jgi:hypothetical protein
MRDMVLTCVIFCAATDEGILGSDSDENLEEIPTEPEPVEFQHKSAELKIRELHKLEEMGMLCES